MIATLGRRSAIFVCLLLFSTAALGQAPTPPFTQCPPVGANTGCSVLITFQKDGKPRVDTDPSQGPYDQIEDTLVGVQNNSNRKVYAIRIKGNAPIFAFDGDGICGTNPNTGQPFNPRPAGCPFGPTTYEGPGVSFAITDAFTGTVKFANGIAANGGSSYFSLEEANFQLALCGSEDPETTEPIGGSLSCPPLGTKPATWGSFGAKTALVSELGEKLELKCEGPGGSLPSFHLYYTPPGGMSFIVGTCPFVGGCNSGTFSYAGKSSAGNPKCFTRTWWRSKDYDANDLPNPWTGANGTDTSADEPVLDWAITNFDVVANNVSKSDIEYKYNPAAAPPIPPVPHSIYCSGTAPPVPAEGALVRTVNLADPPVEDVQAFFALVDQLLQQAAANQPGAGPMGWAQLSLADLNADGTRDIADFQVMRAAFGSCSGDANYVAAADFDGDGCVTFSDFRIFLQLFSFQFP